MSSNTNPAAPPRAFVDTSADCAICLDHLSTSPTLTLTCGHIYHLSCLRAQLTTQPPSPSRRLLLSGCRCAQCQAICTHSALATLTHAYLSMLPRIDALAAEHLRSEGRTAAPTPAQVAAARDRLAFYICAHCREPYVGGTARCADVEDAELATNDRLCAACTPRTSKRCGQPLHAMAHVWKCRYCCDVATIVCYGSTHFCAACHERENARARGDTLAAVECPGVGVCVTGMEDGEVRHRNGTGGECELLLQCGMCEAGDEEGEGGQEEGRNLVYNRNGAEGLAGWESLGGQWKVEREGSGGGTNFVSGYMWCVMGQAVRVGGADADAEGGEPVRVAIGARVRGRWDCPSKFQVVGVLYDADGRRVAEERSGVRATAAEVWEEMRVTVQAAGARYAAIVVMGTDERFWAGEYGAKVEGCFVRELGAGAAQDQDQVHDQVHDHAWVGAARNRAIMRAERGRDYGRHGGVRADGVWGGGGGAHQWEFWGAHD